ncbi:ABC transporter permease [Lederbergia citrea]|uniref:ABC transporter permease n=1 Tax=Lederbergia citrea TaxID=2833581 RepID=UPI001BC8DC68|nr:ABC transporter permease subunit [Lederbergia citrea]MBS4202511.1 ABC transporter permease subunit [Lederbergia citrea]
MNNKPLIVGLILSAVLFFIMFAGPYLPFVDTELEAKRLYYPEKGKIETAPFSPSERYILGSDRDGRDLFSMLILGAKNTIVFIIGIALLRYAIAVPLGMFGYKKKGIVSWIIQGWDKVFSSLPSNLLIIIILNLPFLLYSKDRLIWAFLIIALFDVGRVSQIVQQQSNQLSKKAFIETAKTIGVKPFSMLKNHYLPNLAPEIITNFCIDVGRVTLLIGQLAILNIFLKQELIQVNYGYSEIVNSSLDWPSIMTDTRKDIRSAFWIPFFPALALTYMILTFNMLGEGLRIYFNRHLT